MDRKTIVLAEVIDSLPEPIKKEIETILRREEECILDTEKPDS